MLSVSVKGIDPPRSNGDQLLRSMDQWENDNE